MSTQAGALLLIGEVSTRSGISIKTIRYYEKLDLLQVSTRTEGGFRLFSPDILSRLALIKQAQHVGLSLEEIREMLVIIDQEGQIDEVLRQQLYKKISEIDRRAKQWRSLKTLLSRLVSAYPQDSR